MPIDSAISEYIVREEIFEPDSIILREGKRGDWIFILLEGRVKIKKRTGKGMITVDTLREGAIVGEMSLLTGEKRSATVRALTEVELIVINKNAFGQILIKNPKIAEHLSSMLARRKEEIQTKTTDGISEDDEQSQHDRTSILHKMQYFFGLTRK